MTSFGPCYQLAVGECVEATPSVILADSARQRKGSYARQASNWRQLCLNPWLVSANTFVVCLCFL